MQIKPQGQVPQPSLCPVHSPAEEWSLTCPGDEPSRHLPVEVGGVPLLGSQVVPQGLPEPAPPPSSPHRKLSVRPSVPAFKQEWTATCFMDCVSKEGRGQNHVFHGLCEPGSQRPKAVEKEGAHWTNR